jgi:hypothetical protein
VSELLCEEDSHELKTGQGIAETFQQAGFSQVEGHLGKVRIPVGGGANSSSIVVSFSIFKYIL